MVRTFFAALILALAPVWAVAQDSPGTPGASETDITAGVTAARTVLNEIDASAFPRIRLFATVTRDGDPVGGLRAQDFWVRENGRTQAPLTVAEDLPGLSVALAIDTSGSIRSALDDVRAAAGAFIRGLSPEDAATIVTFADEITIGTDMTTDHAALLAAIAATEARGDTALYDGIATAVAALDGRAGRKAVVLLSDGRDDDGTGGQLSQISLDNALAMAMQVNVPVFVIGLGDALDEPALERIASETGGLFLRAGTSDALAPIFQQIGETLTGQYAISYTSTLPADEWPRLVTLMAEGVGSSKSYALGGLPQAMRGTGASGDALAGDLPGSGAAAGGEGILPPGVLPEGDGDGAGLADDLARALGEDGAAGDGGRFDMSDTTPGAAGDVGAAPAVLPRATDPASAEAVLKTLESISEGGTMTAQEVEMVLRAGSGGLECGVAPVMAAEAGAISSANSQFAAGIVDAATRDANVAASVAAMSAAISAETQPSCLEAALRVAMAMHVGGHIDDAAMKAIMRAAAAASAAVCVSPDGTPLDGAAAQSCDIVLKIVIEGEPQAAPVEAEPEPQPEDLFSFILRKIHEYLGPLGPVILVAGLAFLLILSTIPFLLKKEEDPLDRLKRMKNMAEPEDKKKDGVRLRAKSKNEDKLAKYSNFLEPKNAAEYSAIQLKLMQAGYRSKNAVRMYHFAQFALGLVLLLLGVLYAIYSSATGEPTTQDLAMSILIPGAIGYMGPKYWVNKRQEKRKEEITNGFPDALDMMLVCVEAGQSLDQSIIRVAKEIRAGFPALADEFEIVAWEVKAGKDKINVLRDMSERAGVPDVASFVTVLIQSASFGTSVAEALRVYASEMRDKRVMRAEEKANTLPTKMTLATMMLTVPPLLIILLGPSVYNIAETLGSMGK